MSIIRCSQIRQCVTKQAPLPTEEPAQRLYIIARAFDSFGLCVKYGSAVAIAYIVHLVASDLAGKETWALISIGLKYVGESKKTLVAPWISAILMAIWAAIERKLRKKHIKRAQEHIETLEKKIDPKRTGSNLTQHGETNPKDRI